MRKLLFLLPLVVCAAVAQTADYPSQVTTDAKMMVAANNVATTLSLQQASGDTVAIVANTTGFAPNMLVSICAPATSIFGATGQCAAGAAVEIEVVCSVSGSNTLNIGYNGSCPSTNGRGFDGTTPAVHQAGAIVAVNMDAWHRNKDRLEIEAIETTLGPNMANVAKSAPFLMSSIYAFSPITSGAGVTVAGGNLVIGNNALTFATVPQGVNGADAGHYLYISGGTGTAEACLITGGSGTSGSINGQIIVNCSNTHSGAWTVQSDSGGIYEAANTISAGTVMVPANTTINVCGANGVVVTKNNLSIIGSPDWSSVIQARSGCAINTILQVNGSGTVIRDLSLQGNLAGGGMATNNMTSTLQLGTSSAPAINTLVDHVEVADCGQFGVGYSSFAHDDTVQRSYIHDCGTSSAASNRQLCNAFAISLISTNIPYNIHILNNRIERNYIKDPVNGPGEGGAVGGYVDHLDFTGNTVLDNLNVSGGQVPVNGNYQRIENNRIDRTTTLNNDATDAIEESGQNFVIAGNVMSGYITGEPTHSGTCVFVEGNTAISGYGLITGNVCSSANIGIFFANASSSSASTVVAGNYIKASDATYGAISVDTLSANLVIGPNMLMGSALQIRDVSTNGASIDATNVLQAIGADVASASTITPTGQSFRITGTTTINTINTPAGWTGFQGRVCAVPTGLWATGTGGNIAIASTAVVGKTLCWTYLQASGKWHPSY